ncbi:MAG: DUF2141 domain-containing protein [Flavobacteriaceae bacterium]|nr:DUF2141 domain-containing protein [Bacteroidia bacterium]NNK81904.1 DUF2141 domain-containing protein [Flavobacteriaceae bacterium]
MKTLALLIALFLGTILSNAQETSTQDITVTIENVLNNKGKVHLALHTSDTFMKSDAIQSLSSTIEDSKVTVTFKNVEAGEYAILVLHDENENNRMDYLPSGMPKEAYAMSNNPMLLGPPRFEDAKFQLTNEDLNLSLRF